MVEFSFRFLPSPYGWVFFKTSLHMVEFSFRLLPTPYGWVLFKTSTHSIWWSSPLDFYPLHMVEFSLRLLLTPYGGFLFWKSSNSKSWIVNLHCSLVPISGKGHCYNLLRLHFCKGYSFSHLQLIQTFMKIFCNFSRRTSKGGPFMRCRGEIRKFSSN